MVNNNIKYKLKGVFTSSETVLDYQRVIIEKALTVNCLIGMGLVKELLLYAHVNMELITRYRLFYSRV